jgi:hypothetical protein
LTQSKFQFMIPHAKQNNEDHNIQFQFEGSVLYQIPYKKCHLKEPSVIFLKSNITLFSATVVSCLYYVGFSHLLTPTPIPYPIFSKRGLQLCKYRHNLIDSICMLEKHIFLNLLMKMNILRISYLFVPISFVNH